MIPLLGGIKKKKKKVTELRAYICQRRDGHMEMGKMDE